MSVEHSVLSENADSLKLVEDVATRHELLDQELNSGWTLAMTLAHLAFWDRRVVLLLERWEQDGVMPDEVDDDLMNEALLDEWRALPPTEAARLAVEAARAVNRAVESVSASIANEALNSGNERLLRRGLHRREHLGGIAGR